ncbi:FIST signal transduction protein [Methyloversatilis thermotolerans]|uniref:FIST signal transduction protein n=1 Tax=Methyloversatilis thermotolerans TaxID=1346290 RepID=UPI0003752314|nr:FIST N-terminal domain-containing protein [Methyloversatilis thermotolerans]
MIRFSASSAFHEDWPVAMDLAVSGLDIPRRASLGFAYFSDQYGGNVQDMFDRLVKLTGIPNWVGTSSVGIIGQGMGAQDQTGMSLLVGNLPEGSFRVFSGRERLPNPQGTDTDAEQPYFAIVHADPSTPDMADLVADMASKVSSGFVTGGLALARGQAPMLANGALHGGISGVAFSEQIMVTTRLTQGCCPVGDVHTVTASERNVISEIDGRPAMDAFLSAAGTSLGQDLRRAARYILPGLGVTGRDDASFRVRNVIGLDPDNGLIAINDSVEAGQKLRFFRRDADCARADMRRMLADLRDSLEHPPLAGLYVSCAARGMQMFGDDNAEAQMLDEVFPGLPVAGFFAGGEISHDQLYGYTGVLTLFL